jgi:hypothetical protein
LWRALSATDQYSTWWHWLRRIDTVELSEGSESACVVQGPLPYALRFRVRVVEVDPARLVRAQVYGDLEGPARLEIDPHHDGCTARLVWEVELCPAPLRAMALVGRPLMQWGHDWIVDSGVRQFRRRALGI